MKHNALKPPKSSAVVKQAIVEYHQLAHVMLLSLDGLLAFGSRIHQVSNQDWMPKYKSNMVLV